jgi:hypothetical protein
MRGGEERFVQCMDETEAYQKTMVDVQQSLQQVRRLSAFREVLQPKAPGQQPEFFWWMVCHLYLPHFRAYQMLADLLCVTATACVLQKCLGLQYSHSLSRG